MVQLGFNTGISGITKPTQVVSESKKPIPVIPVKKTITTGVLHPKTSDDDNMVALGIDLITQSKPGDIIIRDYSNKISSGSFDKTVSLTRDITQGSGRNELLKAYPSITPDVISDLYDVNDSIVNPKKEPGVVTNTVAGIVSQIPKMFGNMLKNVVENPQIDPLYMVNGILKLAGKEEIKPFGNEKTGKLSFGEGLQLLGKAAQKDITKFIGADEKTKMYRLGQVAAEIAPFFIMPSLGGEEAGAMATEKISSAVSSKLPNLTNFIQHPTIQRILQKSISSIPSTEATSVLSEGKPASAGQLLGGAVVNTLLPGGTQSRTNKLTKLIGEQQGTKGVNAGVNVGNIEDVGALKSRRSGLPVKVKVTPKTLQSIAAIKKELPEIPTKPAELLDKLLGKSSDIKNKRIGGGVYEKVNNDYDKLLDSVNISKMTKAKSDIKNKISGMLQNASDFIPKTMKREVSKVINEIGKAKTLKDIRLANIKANSFFTDTMKAGTSNNPLEQNIYKVWKPLQEEINSFIDKTASSKGVLGTSEARAMISAIKHAIDQLEKNAGVRGKATRGMKQKLKGFGASVAKLYFLGKVLSAGGVDKTGVAE